MMGGQVTGGKKLISLHDAERDHMKNKSFPNFALMKISAYHKAQGDTVEWWNAIFNAQYGAVYSSKVFDFTPENPYLPPDTIKGGYQKFRVIRNKLDSHDIIVF